jgi:hypothetical protein
LPRCAALAAGRGARRRIRQVPVRRPRAGMINRHRAVLALCLAHPQLISGIYEQLLSMESGDAGLESLKKAAIDAVIGDPDLDVAALTYHLQVWI